MDYRFLNGIKIFGFFQMSFWLAFTGCSGNWGDPASSALAILSKHPASFSERLLALDAQIRQTKGLPPFPTFAESLFVYRKRLNSFLKSESDTNLMTRLVMLKSFVNDSLKIAPNFDSTSVKYSLPSEALMKGSASCVGLSLLYLALAEGQSLPLRPVFLPGHLALRIGTLSPPIYLETLKPLIFRDSAFYDSAFQLASRPWYQHQKVEAAETVLLALTFNWANELSAQGHQPWAEELYRFVLNKLPGFPPAAGNLALLLQEGSHAEEAQALLKTAASGDSLSP